MTAFISVFNIIRLWSSTASLFAAVAFAVFCSTAGATEPFPIPKPYDQMDKARLESLRTCDEVLTTLSKPPRTESFAPKWQRRLILLANLPAYAWNVSSIFYRFNEPGFQIEFEQGPFQGWDPREPVHLRRFRLDYQPSQHHRLSLTRKLFGPTPRVLTIDDVVRAREERPDVDNGTVLHLSLRLNPSGGEQVHILISRDSGLLRVYAPVPDAAGAESVALPSRIGSLWNRALGAVTNFNLGETPGTWFTSP